MSIIYHTKHTASPCNTHLSFSWRVKRKNARKHLSVVDDRNTYTYAIYMPYIHACMRAGMLTNVRAQIHD